MKVSLRKRPLRNNRTRLYFDYYPPLLNPKTGKKSRKEILKLYMYDKPKNDAEKLHNKETWQLAENVRARRQLDLQSQLLGFTPDHQRLQSFNNYFRKLANRQRGMNRHNWDSSVRYFEKFTEGQDLRFIDINLSLCEDFKAYLRNGPKLREKRAGIGHNSALSYFNKFRNALKQAWREKLIPDDLYALSPGLKEREALVEFLTMSDIKQLLNTPTTNELCKRVTLFGILTGLRFCDIHALTWQEVRGIKDEYYLQFSQLKTLKTQHMPIANQAYDPLGEPGAPDERVFKRLYYNQIRDFLVEWTKQAGVQNTLPFVVCDIPTRPYNSITAPISTRFPKCSATAM